MGDDIRVSSPAIDNKETLPGDNNPVLCEAPITCFLNYKTKALGVNGIHLKFNHFGILLVLLSFFFIFFS